MEYKAIKTNLNMDEFKALEAAMKRVDNAFKELKSALWELREFDIVTEIKIENRWAPKNGPTN